MLSTKTTSNIDAVLAEARQAVGAVTEAGGTEHVLEIRNTAPYAEELHDRHGYWVMNDDVLQASVEEQLAIRLEKREADGKLLSSQDVVDALEEAAEWTVEAYQEVVGSKNTTGTVRPPPRPRHPGEWADDSGLLAASYESRVDGGAWSEHAYEDELLRRMR